MRANLEICQLHPENHEALVTIRRSFHTLKGSGRMVGLNDLGEVAWSVERAMNKWLQDNKTATPEVLSFIKIAVPLFASWVDMLNNQVEVTINADDLVAAAQKIENGLESEIQPAITTTIELPSADSGQVETASFTPAPETPDKIEVTNEAAVPSPALFNIASDEARQNVAILRQQFDELRAAVPPVVKYDFMRAAHTLAGVSRTMGFAIVVELASALESWLQARVEQPFTLSENQLQLLEQSIAALDEMIQSISDQAMPQMRSDLVNQLLDDKDNFSGVAMEPVTAPERVLPLDAIVPQAQETESDEHQVSDDLYAQLMADLVQVSEPTEEQRREQEITLPP
jgi:chemosensory pili system protein ChpA (sensor histidine kinase/response regulator)